MARIYRRPHADTMDALMLLESGGLEIAVVGPDVGIAAGQLHARRYDRKTSPLSMADCVALATSAAVGEPIATSDPALAAAAPLEGVAIIPLPDSTGRRPTT